MRATLGTTLWVLACVCVCVGAYQGSHGHMGRHPQYQGSHGHMGRHPQGQQRGEGGGKHHHHVPKRPPGSVYNPKLLEDNQLIHDREHLKEDLPDYIPMDKIAEMSDRELDYHYFRMHDFDENLKLDGLEIMAAIMHVADDADDEDDEGGDVDADKDKEGETRLAGLSEEEQKVLKNYRQEKWHEKVNFYVELVDAVMNENDLNKDGFLSWTEFLRGRRRDV